MKQKLLFIASLMMLATLSYAQGRAGLHLGSGGSQLRSKTDYNGRATFIAGFIGEYKTKSNLVWHGELNYVNKGATLYNPETQQANGVIDKYKFSLNYVELPLSVGYALRIGNTGAITPRAGIYGAYGFEGKGTMYSPNINPEDLSSSIGFNPFDGTEGNVHASPYSFGSFNRLDMGVLVGLDIDFSKHIRLSANAQMNLASPLAKYSDAGTVRFRTLNVSLGYMF